jgi:hypothetical protein
MESYLLVVSGVSILHRRLVVVVEEAKLIPKGLCARQKATTSTKPEETGYENHPTVNYLACS